MRRIVLASLLRLVDPDTSDYSYPVKSPGCFGRYAFSAAALFNLESSSIMAVK